MRSKNVILLLVPVLPLLLVCAQTIWAIGVKRHHVMSGSPPQIAVNLLTSLHIWAGTGLYIIATLLHLFLLSQLRFFSVTVSVTAMAVVLSTLSSVLIFKEQFNLLNIAGALLVVVGIPLVLLR
jgi:drug/metabolite transporter (DMT)-like permease